MNKPLNPEEKAWFEKFEKSQEEFNKNIKRGGVSSTWNSPLQATYDSPHSFQDDHKFENGNFVHECPQCGKAFIGHKRRSICKVCEGEEK